MGCQSSVVLGNNLTFSVTTHDPDTGVLTDADAVPSYRIYEDETATAILTGDMAKLDDVNTMGFYTEKITCSAANGFEVGKSYTVYIEATVDGDKGGITYAFTVEYSVWADTVAEMSQGAPPASPTPIQILNYLYRRFRNKQETTPTTNKVYDDAGTTVLFKETHSDDGTTFNKGEYGSGA